MGQQGTLQCWGSLEDSKEAASLCWAPRDSEKHPQERKAGSSTFMTALVRMCESCFYVRETFSLGLSLIQPVITGGIIKGWEVGINREVLWHTEREKLQRGVCWVNSRVRSVITWQNYLHGKTWNVVYLQMPHQGFIVLLYQWLLEVNFLSTGCHFVPDLISEQPSALAVNLRVSLRRTRTFVYHINPCKQHTEEPESNLQPSCYPGLHWRPDFLTNKVFCSSVVAPSCGSKAYNFN